MHRYKAVFEQLKKLHIESQTECKTFSAPHSLTGVEQKADFFFFRLYFHQHYTRKLRHVGSLCNEAE